MIEQMAQAATSQADVPWWIPYLALGVPLGVVIAALISGRVSLRAVKKTPHERLVSLITALKDWPEDMPGKESIRLSIEVVLAEIRYSEQLSNLPHIAVGGGIEVELDRFVFRKNRRILLVKFFATVLCVLAFMGAESIILDVTSEEGRGLFAFTGGLGCIAMIVVAFGGIPFLVEYFKPRVTERKRARGIEPYPKE
ncbi:hypothetical protein ACFVUS_12380 [Nocardia sp. NPDC058058]|uniref:hypothetical protein n=1 Tax=Nocardia sp. NPDC058058 TaxID=3346317 RepID=UPI0036DA80CA